MLPTEPDFTPRHHLVLWLHCQLFVYYLWTGTRRSSGQGAQRFATEVASIVRPGLVLETEFTPILIDQYHLQGLMAMV